VITIEFGELGSIRLDTGKVSIDMKDLLSREVGRIRAKDSSFFNYPMEEGETLEDWQERCGDEADAEWAVRRIGESVEDHVIRINSPRSSATKLAREVMNSFHVLLTGDPNCFQVDEKTLGACNWKRIREKLHQFCVEADVWIPEFAPKGHKST
jgi:hypothetical protein